MHSDEPVAGSILVIPSKRYFTISEVSSLCDVKPHVLRYWEQEFTVLRPSKRRGNRRYYRREDVLIVSQIKGLLYDQGYTISGARLQLAQQKHATPAPVVVDMPLVQDLPVVSRSVSKHSDPALIEHLKEVLKILS